MNWFTGKPMIYFFDTCTASIRTIPVLQHDAKRPEDVDTESEDHAADETRYACMSRPWLKKKPDPYDRSVDYAPKWGPAREEAGGNLDKWKVDYEESRDFD